MNKYIVKIISQWESSDGNIFNYTYWPSHKSAEVQPDVVLIAVHGLSGSANDFYPLANHLSNKNYVTYAYEMRTQGNDPKVKRRGDLIDWHILIRDLKDFCDYIYTLHPEATHILAGESMGAVVTINACSIENYLSHVEGLILFAPVTELDIHFQQWQIYIFRLLTKILPLIKFPPGWFNNSRGRSRRISSDDIYEKYLQQAPHRIKYFTARFYYSLFKMVENCNLAASKINLPVLLLYAGNDIYIKTNKVESFFAHLNSIDKHKQLYPDAFHLLLHDTITPKVLNMVENWIDRLHYSIKGN